MNRPLRFTAILTRQGDRWIFRQIHFQWDDRDPGVLGLLRSATYGRLARVEFARLEPVAAPRGEPVAEVKVDSRYITAKAMGCPVLVSSLANMILSVSARMGTCGSSNMEMWSPGTS